MHHGVEFLGLGLVSIGIPRDCVLELSQADCGWMDGWMSGRADVK